ncbi:MAG: cytochrome c biogenesis protein CcsA [bacterium]|nr:cytochrome c biogenesis protein CcsA [bacterium]
MKYALMLGVAVLGVAFGFWPSLRERKPLWWRWFAIFCVTATVVLALLPPIGGTLADVIIATRADSTKVVPFYCVPMQLKDYHQIQNGSDELVLVDARNPGMHAYSLESPQFEQVLRSHLGMSIIVNVRSSRSDQVVRVDDQEIVAVNPLITLPYIMGLEERARIIFFHVPMAWIAFIAYLIAMVFGIKYLRNRSLADDAMSASAASVGTLFTILATLSGAVWAKFNWGEYWNWDPRQTTIFLLLLVYAAYFVLRSAMNDEHLKARLSSVYSIIAFVTVPFLIFILPRLAPGLHPGSSDDTSIGPLLSTKSDAINLTKQLVFLLSLFSFTLVFFWLMNLRYRTLTLERSMNVVQDPTVNSVRESSVNPEKS